jgi:hypothetical protein
MPPISFQPQDVTHKTYVKTVEDVHDRLHSFLILLRVGFVLVLQSCELLLQKRSLSVATEQT